MNGSKANQPFSLAELEQLLGIVKENGITEFRLERGDEKVVVKREQQTVEQHIYGGAGVWPQPQLSNQEIGNGLLNWGAAAPAVSDVERFQSGGQEPDTRPEGQIGLSSKPIPVADSSFVEQKSPMVGTFYRRPSPDAEAFVSVGERVKKGQVLCIIEAMKVMNEIEAEHSGKLVEVCLDDGQVVEFAEVLFRIDPKG